MKKLIFLLILIIVVIGGYSFWKEFSESFPGSNTTTLSQPTVSTITIGDSTYIIEVKDDDNERAQGLSGRDSLPADQGMLFVFETKDRYSFWMRGMKFPLDFIWIEGDTIMELTENVPVPLTETYAPLYQPKVPVDKVLEVNAGEVKKNEFTIGQKVMLMLIKKQIENL